MNLCPLPGESDGYNGLRILLRIRHLTKCSFLEFPVWNEVLVRTGSSVSIFSYPTQCNSTRDVSLVQAMCGRI
ncbi:hypothetical protein VTI74DRAFT_3053 [Chaetomium olivicolor]